jgi:hypothetical protein
MRINGPSGVLAQWDRDKPSRVYRAPWNEGAAAELVDAAIDAMRFVALVCRFDTAEEYDEGTEILDELRRCLSLAFEPTIDGVDPVAEVKADRPLTAAEARAMFQAIDNAKDAAEARSCDDELPPFGTDVDLSPYRDDEGEA